MITESVLEESHISGLSLLRLRTCWLLFQSLCNLLTGICQSFLAELAYVPMDTRESQKRVTFYSWRILQFPELFIWEVDSWCEGKQRCWRGQILSQGSSILELNWLFCLKLASRWPTLSPFGFWFSHMTEIM